MIIELIEFVQGGKATINEFLGQGATVVYYRVFLKTGQRIGKGSSNYPPPPSSIPGLLLSSSFPTSLPTSPVALIISWPLPSPSSHCACAVKATSVQTLACHMLLCYSTPPLLG